MMYFTYFLRVNPTMIDEKQSGISESRSSSSFVVSENSEFRNRIAGYDTVKITRLKNR